MEDITGRIYPSNNCGDFKILGRINYVPEDYTEPGDYTNRRFAIQFLNTGYITDASLDCIYHGRVKDKMMPCVAGIGFIGSDITVSDPKYKPFYRSWNDMMHRCHNPNDGDYKYYGALGVRVDERWFNFTNYLLDIAFLPGFDKKLAYLDVYNLDKDYLQLNLPKSQRVYSRDTCVWLSKYDNSLLMDFEKGSSSGYFGVIYRDGSWQTRIHNTVYGRFTIPEAAANLFNYYYPILRTYFSDIPFENHVETIPFEDLKKYCVGSTTIREAGVGYMSVRSDRASHFPEMKI